MKAWFALALLLLASCSIERPDTFTTTQNETVDLSGKVILNFWASWCPPCSEEMPALDSVHEESEWTVIGINLAEPRSVIDSFVDEHNLSMHIVEDADGSIRRAWNVRTQPVTYFIEDGVVVDQRFGALTDAEFSRLGTDVERNVSIEYLEDGTPYLVHPDELLSGGPPKDGIPSIDDPRFVAASEADLDPDELVIGLDLREARAYPFSILVWHEIVNDVIDDRPVLVTYCPLCGTGIVFDRVLDGEPVEFGVSGKLYNSDLVMYDRKTDSYWQQLTGEAIIGEMVPRRLGMIPSNVMPWSQWRSLHPDTLVLSEETGFSRDYDRDPYGGYYDSDSTLFPADYDDQLHPKAVVFGFDFADGVAIREENIEDGASFDAAGTTWTIETDGLRVNSEEGSYPLARSFWFAWSAFHPDSELV